MKNTWYIVFIITAIIAFMWDWNWLGSIMVALIFFRAILDSYIILILKAIAGIEGIYGANNRLFISLKIENILSSEVAKRGYKRLLDFYKSDYSPEEFEKMLIKNFESQYSKEDLNEISSTVDIVSDSIFIDGERVLDKTIIRELEISLSDDEKLKSEKSFPSDFDVYKIRFIVINGAIKVQLGEFIKETTAHMFRDGAEPEYFAWDTVTTYPLVYFSHEYNLPTKILGQSIYNTAVGRNLVKGMEEGSEELKEWRKLQNVFEKYTAILSVQYDDRFLEKRIPAINKLNERSQKSINEARDELYKIGSQVLKDRGFQSSTLNDDYFLQMRKFRVLDDYNNYMGVQLLDYNKVREVNYQYNYLDHKKDEFII